MCEQKGGTYNVKIEGTEANLPMAVWHVAPIKIPSQVLADLKKYARNHDMTMAETCLVAAMTLLGYEEEAVKCVRTHAYSTIKRGRPPNTDTDKAGKIGMGKTVKECQEEAEEKLREILKEDEPKDTTEDPNAPKWQV